MDMDQHFFSRKDGRRRILKKQVEQILAQTSAIGTGTFLSWIFIYFFNIEDITALLLWADNFVNVAYRQKNENDTSQIVSGDS